MGDVKVEERPMDEDELAPVTKARSLGALYYRTYGLVKSVFARGCLPILLIS
jgi:hypothetical protein